MGSAFVLLTLAAFAGIQAFARLPKPTQDTILTKVKAMFDAAAERMNNLIFRRRSAYRRALTDGQGNLTHDGRVIVAHLAKFCRATTSKGVSGNGPMGAHVDANATLIAVGRNEVFMAIMKELAVDIDRVFYAVHDEERAQASLLA